LGLLEQVETGLRQALATAEEGGPFAGLGPDCPDRLRAAMRHSLLAGGKRLRPVLTLACYDACRPAGGETGENRHGDFNALRAAVAVELVHTYSLIHDDLPCMDDDDLRRGRPTCHVAFDEATAVLAGDALLTLAFECLAAFDPSDGAAKCVAQLARAAGATGMVGGQVADLEAEAASVDLSTPSRQASWSAALQSVHHRKTAALIAAACELGGIVAGANRETLAGLRTYGRHLGLAFQIADDLLDRSADSAALGKTAGKDEASGKLTYPALHGREGRVQLAETVTAEALRGLGPLGDAAAPLRTLARYAIDRDR
ncbi:MAG: polyprenyl synthetase family protein, partial [Planctomycetota bacterium]